MLLAENKAFTYYDPTTRKYGQKDEHPPLATVWPLHRVRGLEAPTTEPLKGYTGVLNALDEMQRSKIYAVRGQVLQEAEASIVYLATALHEAREQLRQAYAGFGPLR